MPRPTLKLPAQPASQDADGENRPYSRKPTRAGAKVPKQSVAQRASSNAAKAERLAAEAKKTFKSSDKPRSTARFREDAAGAPARPAGPARSEAGWKRETPPRDAPPARAARAPEAPKSYPKRVVARSTGARALPPARPYGEPQALRGDQERRSVAAPLPATPQPTVTVTPPLKPIPPHLQA
ncbi:MAG: hypothetical protein WAZ34_01615, partial [Rhodocyclaceae bacterium]